MSDEDALLAAIAADPAADTPRLVYADWLDDHADPRAEYVRLEVERHQLKPRDKRRPELTARLEALRPAADPHWLCRIDRITRRTCCWSVAECRQVRDNRPDGEVLGRVRAAPFPRNAATGEYVYVLTYYSARLHLVGRMRVRTWMIAGTGPPFVEYLAGTEGTRVRFDLEVPAATLARFEYRSGRTICRLRLTDSGRIRTLSDLHPVLRLTPATAADLDALLRADPPPA